MFTGTIELEQRIWMRRKWTRQTARLDACGLLKISSASIYEKLEYNLRGATAVFMDGDRIDIGTGQQPNVQITLDPRLQIDNVAVLSFRLISMDDLALWAVELSRQSEHIFVCVYSCQCGFASRFCKVRKRIRDSIMISSMIPTKDNRGKTVNYLRKRKFHQNLPSKSSDPPVLSAPKLTESKGETNSLEWIDIHFSTLTCRNLDHLQ